MANKKKEIIKDGSDVIQPARTDFINFIHEVKSNKKTSTTLTDRDEKFALLSELDGWKEFKDMANKKIEDIMSLRDYESAGRDLSELGLRFLVADMVADVVESLLRKVDQAKELFDAEQRAGDRTS